MDFRIKCAAQHVFSAVPGGRRLNYLMQRYVTRNLPVPDSWLANYRKLAELHLRNFASVTGGKPQRIFEFGSGSHLGLAIIFGLAGSEVVASDITRQASQFLIDDMLRRLGASSLEQARVTYLAPCDTKSTGLASASFDMVTSTSVLEHVPADEIPPILAECRRLLAPGGLCSFCIDYTDHWSHFDGSLARTNFLRYDERTWPLYNPGLHYQNRLRHSDFLKMFKEAGFDVALEQRDRGTPPSAELAPEFRHYSRDDLETEIAYLILRAARQ